MTDFHTLDKRAESLVVRLEADSASSAAQEAARGLRNALGKARREGLEALRSRLSPDNVPGAVMAHNEDSRRLLRAHSRRWQG